jgi:hypothetical protein
MFKRATWFSVGLLAGAGVSKWAERQARRRLARYLPAARLEAGRQAAGRARDTAAGRVADLRQAVEDGREAMVVREQQLRRQFRLAPDEPVRPHLVPPDDDLPAGRGQAPGRGPGPRRYLAN